MITVSLIDTVIVVAAVVARATCVVEGKKLYAGLRRGMTTLF